MTDIDLTPVVSSRIAAIGHDADNQVLRVEFQDGTVYDYDDVPASVYDGMRTATSIGRYFENYVKGRYRFIKQ